MTSYSSLAGSPSHSVLLSCPPCIVFALAYMYVTVTFPLLWGVVNDVYIGYSEEQLFRPAQER